MRPASIGPYHIVKELGRGAMGVVYLGYDSDIERPVAIKTIQVGADEPEAEELRQALGRDARAAGRLSHPGIVTIFHMGRDQDAVFVVMEFVDGPTLAAWASATPRQPPEIVAMLRKVAEALDYAHSVPIVHRDIKPANILVAPNGQPKITDFGMAKLATAASSRSGHMVGTPRYISPEQIRGAQADGRSDQFSLAIIAYELLTGRLPFPAPTYEALLYQILSQHPAPAHQVNPRLSPVVSQVLARALSKEPAQRYSTCLDFLTALEAAMVAQWIPIPTRPEFPAFTPRQSSRFQPYYGLLIMVPIVLAIAFMMPWLLNRLSKTPAGSDGITLPSEATQSTLSNIAPAPYVLELPSIVEESRNPKIEDPVQIVGPRKAKVEWKARVQIPDADQMLRVVGNGPEGVIYLLGNGSKGELLCAMRDSKLLWGHSHVAGAYFRREGDFDLAPDGRIWMVENDAKFCFNSKGQGGHLPVAAKPWTRPRRSTFEDTLRYDYLSRRITGSGYSCLPDAHNNFPTRDRPGLLGRAWTGGDAWFLPLDQACPEHGRPTTGPNGDAYLQTISQRLYRVSPQGQLRFSYAAACMAKEYYPLPSGDVLFHCGSDLYRVHDGNLQWKFSWRSEFKSGLVIDKAETLYSIEDFGNKSFSDQSESHVVAVSASGEKLWEIGLREFKFEDLFLDATGRIYLTASAGFNNGKWAIICLRD